MKNNFFFQVYDHDWAFRDDFMGEGNVPLSSLALDKLTDFVVDLEEEGNTEKQEDAIPRVLRLNGAKSVVGRVSSSAVNLAVGVATVSSAHAMVDLTPDGKVMVTDLTSTNGTYIDGEELLPGIPQELTEGGEVIFGDEHCARFELVVEP